MHPRTIETSRGLPKYVSATKFGYRLRFRPRGQREVNLMLGTDRQRAIDKAHTLMRHLQLPLKPADQQYAKAMFYSTLRNAKTRKLPNELTLVIVEDMLAATGNKCAITRIPFDFDAHPTAKRRPWIPSIDRIDNTKGYTVENCRIVCLAVNFAMNQWGLEALERIALHLPVRKLRVSQLARNDVQLDSEGVS